MATPMLTAPDHIQPFALRRTFREDWSGGIDPNIWTTHYTYLGDTQASSASLLSRRGNVSELECYVDPAFNGVDPFTTDSHGLTITATRTPDALLDTVGGRPFMSGMVDSFWGFSQLYGYFEWRGVLPNDGAGAPVPGVWPAFWHATNPAHLEQDRSECDALEVAGEFDPLTLLGKAHSTLHWPAGGAMTKWSLAIERANLYDGSSHAWGTLWTPDIVAFYFDHQLAGSIAAPSALVDPWTCIMNLAIGGRWPDSMNPELLPPNTTVPYPAFTQAQFRCSELNVYALK